jgi:hypothetical protein
MKRASLLVALLPALLALATPAHAHTRSQSQSAWVIEDDAIVARVEADAVDVTRLYALGGEAPLAETFAAEAEGAFDVRAGGQHCVRDGEVQTSVAGAGAGRLIALLRFECPAGALARAPIEIETRLFLRVAPSHLHFVSLRDERGGAAEAVLTESRPAAALTPAQAPPRQNFLGALARFFPIGAEHVWSGVDHVAFMLALVLLVGARLRAAVFAASGFTLGHTATLGLAATGVLNPDIAAIEALIGFTIAFVALEVGAAGAVRIHAWSAPIAAVLALAGAASLFGLAPMAPLIWFGLAAFVYAYPRGFPRDATWLAAIFGLIHGCGFAGALSELDLPRPHLIASLLGFNLGVEAGQVVVIGLAVLAGFATRRLPENYRTQALALAGAALFALGLFWFVERLAA